MGREDRRLKSGGRVRLGGREGEEEENNNKNKTKKNSDHKKERTGDKLSKIQA